MDGLSDEAVCARWLDSPYVQLFCGETHFQHALPLDRSSMTRWRQRIGPERLELLLAESLDAAQRGGAVEEKHLRRVTIDTTVQPKAVTHPTDSKLLQVASRSWHAWPDGTASGCGSPIWGWPSVPGARPRS